VETRNGALPQTYFASMVHDALYQYFYELPYTRKQMDDTFHEMLKASGFKHAGLYYLGVRLFGGVSKWIGRTFRI